MSGAKNSVPAWRSRRRSVAAAEMVGQGQDEQDGVGLDRPDEERNAHPRHPGRAHVVDRDDEVDRSRERRERGQVDPEDPEVLADYPE